MSNRSHLDREVTARRGFCAINLERLVEKVGGIDLHAGDGEGVDALLTRLVRLKAPEPA